MLLDEIKLNLKYSCIRCDDKITLDNYTGWEEFLPDGKTTQPICKFCEMIEDALPHLKEGE